MKKKSSAAKTALSGVFAAVCVALLFIGSLIDTLDLSAAAAASVAVLAVLIEAGAGYAFGAYAAASVISLLILPQKSAAHPHGAASFNRILTMPLLFPKRSSIFFMP